MKLKSEKNLMSFLKYCQEHPEHRFWQALRNWNQEKNPKEHFILTGEMNDIDTNDEMWKNLDDTFYRN